MKYGIEFLGEEPGDGPLVERHEYYRIRVKMAEPGRSGALEPSIGSLTDAHIEEDGATLVTDVRMDRVFLIPGLSYGSET